MNAVARPPLDGEVIAPGEMLGVLAFMHPLRTDHRLVLVPVGSSVAEIVAACERECGLHRLTDGCRVTINGEAVPPALWQRLRPKAGVHIAVRAVPRGFVVPLIVSAIGSVITLTPFVSTLLTAGLSLLANLVMSALFPPSATKADKQKTLYSIGGARNQVAKWEPIPSVLGEIRMAAKYAASPYTTFEGDDQYLHMLLVWGFGPLDIKKLKIGESDIANFEDVEVQTFPGILNTSAPNIGLPDHLNQTIYKGEVVQEDLGIELSKQDGPHIRDSADDAIELQVDFVAPQGIYQNGDEGPSGQDQRFKVEYKPYGAADTAYVLWQDARWTGDGPKPQRKTYRIQVAAGQYTVRVTKIYNDDDDDDTENVRTINWTALRSFRDSAPIEFPIPLAVTALRIKATGQLNGTPDDINAVVCTKARQWNGTTWVANQLCRNPGDLFRHVLQGPANKRPVPDAKIDLTAVQTWRQRCAAKGFTFDMVRDFRASVWDTLRDVCAAGRAVPLFRDGVWSVAWEDRTLPIVQHFTPRNSWNMRRRQDYRRLPDAFRVKFLDRDKEWIEDERLVYNDGKDKTNTVTTEMLELPGVTTRSQVHKLARYRLAEGKLRPATYTLSTDMDHLVCTRGDRVYVAHDVLLNTLGFGRVKAVSGQVVTLDDSVTMEAGKSYGIRFRRADGTSLLRSVVTVAGVSAQVTLAGTGAVPSDGGNKSAGDLWSFGPAGQEAGVYLVKEIRHSGDFAAELDLVDEAPQIENADDEAIPAYDSGIVPPVDLRQFSPKNLRVVETVEVVNGIAVHVNTLFWEVSSIQEIARFTAQAQRGSDVVTVTVPGYQRYARFLDLAPGAWSYRVQSVFRAPRRNAAGTLSNG